ncbi:MAG TPA: hypothetical protein VEZ11_08220 [Thermoanaerobaculia bacterium]|nr:hypothetical protein [Thermoanaerobaculia bacterium]
MLGASILTLLAVSAILLACGPSPPSPKARGTPAHSAPAGPAMRATVATIHTVIQPENESWDTTIVFTAGLARSFDESDSWRLYDLANQRVTFVDDLAKSSRTETLEALIEKHRAALAGPLPEGTPQAAIAKSDAKRTIDGIQTEQWVIRLGGYTRELWIAPRSPFPPRLFAMMRASRSVTTPLAGVSSNVDEALLGITGFPLADHTEMVYGSTKIVIDRSVVKIEEKDVPRAWLEAPVTDVKIR